MEGVSFIPFPKPKTQREKCERWIRLCGRKYFSVENVRKETYICFKHFVSGKGPTAENPDPLPALASNFERTRLLSKGKRKSPCKRQTPQKTHKRKRLVFEPDDSSNDTSNIDSDNNLPDCTTHTDHCYFNSDNLDNGHSVCMSSFDQVPEPLPELVNDNQSSVEDTDFSFLEVFETTLGLYEFYLTLINHPDVSVMESLLCQKSYLKKCRDFQNTLLY